MRHKGIVSFLVGSVLLAGAAFDAHARQTEGKDTTLSPAKEKEATKTYTAMNRQLLEFCQAKVGQKVGNGQCGEFVAEGIRNIGARLRFPPFPDEGDYVWGVLVCTLEVEDGKPIRRIGSAETGGKMEPGDVIQYRDVRFEGRTPTGTYFSTADHHTAVVASVSADGNSCDILEQNFDGKLYVVRRTHFLPDLQRGVLRVYRPIALAPRPDFFSRIRSEAADSTGLLPRKSPPVGKPQKSTSKASTRKAPAKQKPSRPKSP